MQLLCQLLVKMVKKLLSNFDKTVSTSQNFLTEMSTKVFLTKVLHFCYSWLRKNEMHLLFVRQMCWKVCGMNVIKVRARDFGLGTFSRPTFCR